MASRFSAAMTALCVMGASLAFSANYYWNPAVTDGAWSSADNWCTDIAGTKPATDYPRTTGDAAYFTSVTSPTVVTLSERLTIQNMLINKADLDLTLKGGPNGTNDVLTLNNFDPNAAGGRFVLDNAAVYRNANLTFGTGRKLQLKNGANFRMNALSIGTGGELLVEGGSYAYFAVGSALSGGVSVTIDGGSSVIFNGALTLYAGAGELTVSNGSYLRSNGLTIQKGVSAAFTDASEFYCNGAFYMKNGNSVLLSGHSLVTSVGEFQTMQDGPVSQLTIDDSTLICKNNLYLSNGGNGGDIVLFKGANPVLRSTGNNFWAGKTTGGLMNFEVPVGGFVEAPIQSLGGSYVQNNNSGNMYLNVLASSPALAMGSKVVTPLLYALGSTRTDRVLFNHASNAIGASAMRFTQGTPDAVTTKSEEAHAVYAEFGSGEPVKPTVEKSTGTATFIATSVAHKTVTVKTTVLQLSTAAAKTRVVLYVGESADSMTAFETREITSAGPQLFTWTAPDGMFERTYQFRVDVEDLDEDDEVLNAEQSAVASAYTVDTATYTWVGGKRGNWSDPANWSNNKSGDCNGRPMSINCTVQFNAGTKTTIVLDEPEPICGNITFTAAGLNVTIENGGASTNENKLVFNGINMDATGDATLVLDGIAARCNGGITLGRGKRLVLRNGANFQCGDFWNSKCGWLELYDQSFLSVNQFGVGTDGTAPITGGTIVDDSTLFARSHIFLGYNKAGGFIRFQGAQPRFWSSNSAAHFRSNLGSAGVRMEFVVPVGGFAEPVISGVSNISTYMGNNGGSVGSSTISVNILDESPANRVDATVTTPLIAWPKGINKTQIVEGDLPDDGKGTDDAFVWSAETYPLTLGATITGSTHANTLTISGSPEAVPSPEISPAYGEYDIGLGATRGCSAPMGIVTLSDNKRATCTGWKLYTVDPMTRERTLIDSGNETSCTFTNDDGLWHELEWQWKVEYKITVTSAGNGTAAADEEWVETGKKAHITQTPAAGYGFGKWTGDVPAERDKSMELRFTVRDRAYSFEASFLPVVYVDGQNGNDSHGGTSWGDALQTISAALAKNANGYILLADGTYEVTSQIALTGGATIAGATPGAKAVVKCMAKLSADTTAPSSVFKLAHEDARLYNLTITTDYDKNDSTKNAYGTQRNQDFARGVWLEGNGLVDSCVITNCRSIYCSGEGGGGVFLNNGGVVRNSILTHNTTYASGGNNAHGHNAIIKTAGLIESCVLSWGAVGNNVSSSAGVSLRGKNAILRNCLVTHNTQGHDNTDGATGVKLEPGIMENCTVAENFHAASAQTKAVFIYTQDSVIRNCVIWGNRNTSGIANWDVRANTPCTLTCNCTTPEMSGDGNVTGDPAFVSASGDDFHLGLSGAVDSGMYLDWMDWVDDLDGHDRVQGGTPDMGCYEFTASALTCGFDVVTEGVLGTDSITLTALVMGKDLDGLVYTWTLTDQAGTVTTRSGAELATLTLPMPVGIYTVSLAVANGAGDSTSATRPEAFSVYPSDVYVSLDGTEEYPYGSYETGAKTLAAAYAAASDGTVIHVNDGWHYLADTLAVSKGVTIVSENGPDRTFVYGRAKTSSNPLVYLSNARATFSGITLTGKDPDGTQPQQWGGLRMSGGTVTNCCVCNHKTVSISILGAGCRLEGGTLVDSLFTNNWTACSGGAGEKGGAIYQTGADSLVDRCIIASNQVSSGQTSYGGGICVGAGTLRNSLVIGNYCVNYGGGVAVEGTGKMFNCTVVGNRAGTGNGGIWKHATNGTVADCLAYNNEANGSLEDMDDPGFVDAKNGDYHLDVASAAVDASVTFGIGTLDLDRMPRMSGRRSESVKRADKGCYEYDFNQFSIGISFAKLTKFAPGEVELKADSTDELDPAMCWWTFDGSEPTANNHAAAGVCVTNTFGYGAQTVRFKTVYDNTTYAFDKPDWFTMYGETVYLVEENANPVFPYATPETAATNLYEAIVAVQEDSTLLIGDGEYQIQYDHDITLTYPVTVRSVNGPSKTVLVGNKPGFTDQYRAFVTTHPQAVISGLTFLRGVAWANGGGVYLNGGGVVTNCVFESCGCKNPNSGAAFINTSGTIVDCVFNDSFVCYDGRINLGAAIYGWGPNVLIDRCVVRGTHEGKKNNVKPEAFTCGDGAICLQELSGKAGTVRNTVVAGSVMQGCGGIVVFGNGTVENCTVYGNTTTNSAFTAGIAISNVAAKVVNTISYGNTSCGAISETGGVAGYADRFDHCWFEDPHFSGRSGAEFGLKSGSPCRDTGTNLDWMDGAVDVYGKPRVFGGKELVDIGAAECQRAFGTELILR